MSPVHIKLVIFSLADVAMQGGCVPARYLTNGVRNALAELMSEAGIVNHASPKLCGVYDEFAGDVSIIYRVRTGSRSLAPSLHWCPVELCGSSAVRLAFDMEQT